MFKDFPLVNLLNMIKATIKQRVFLIFWTIKMFPVILFQFGDSEMIFPKQFLVYLVKFGFLWVTLYGLNTHTHTLSILYCNLTKVIYSILFVSHIRTNTHFQFIKLYETSLHKYLYRESFGKIFLKVIILKRMGMDFSLGVLSEWRQASCRLSDYQTPSDTKTNPTSLKHPTTNITIKQTNK